MRSFTCSNGLLISILLQMFTHINAEPVRVSVWDWDLYIQQNVQALKNILSEIGAFKTARQANCAVGGPNDPVVLDPNVPTSLYYSTGTLNITLAGFQDAIDEAITASETGLDPAIVLQEFGFESIQNALVSERRLEMTAKVYNDMIAQFLESGSLMDEFPSTGRPSPFDDYNIRALARLIEGATLPGTNPEDDVKVDPNSRPLFVDYWQSLIEEADRKRFLAIAGVTLARKYFDTEGFTKLIKHRSGMPQNSSFTLTVSGLLRRIEAFFTCWKVASQRVLGALGQLGDLPEPVSNHRWVVKLDGKEIVGMVWPEDEDSSVT
ncbi:hypothetical protein TWF718_008839 [Orbilia javanica]|uniref:Uncharacterized protein n=1 Tax=Orbilia javanica TaxID=47235 RepID=A0AAN8MNN2_9PEZI